MEMVMNPHDAEMLRRLIRIETRLSKLMAHLGLHPRTGEPIDTTRNTHDHNHNHDLEGHRERHPDRW